MCRRIAAAIGPRPIKPALPPKDRRAINAGKSFSQLELGNELFQSSKAVAMTAARNVMSMRRTCGGLAAMLVASSAFADLAVADTMTMWVRVSGTNAAAHLVDLWNATHGAKIEISTIPDT